jgi:sugar transferase (PEP-CTERM/EpsH1 system associated)
MVDLHGENRRYRILRRICGLFIHRHITVSENLADWLRETVHTPAGKITQIYNGVDTEKFFPARAQRSVLGGDGFVEPDSVVIGTVGRMAAVKNPLTLLRAFISLLKRNSDQRSKLRLVMIGDGPLRAGVKEMVETAGIQSQVWLPGERDDVADLLAGFDIFVIPSLNEGISNTILEAMATGLPVVATDVGGNPELITPGHTGLLVKAGDSAALADGIQSYLDRPSLRAEHGAEGRRVVEKDFSLRSMVGQYLAVYDALAGMSKPVEAG